jgi:hypothetical protein
MPADESMLEEFTEHVSDVSGLDVIVVNLGHGVTKVTATERTLIVSELDERNFGVFVSLRCTALNTDK